MYSVTANARYVPTAAVCPDGQELSPHVSPIREEMAQDIGFTVHCARAAHTHCICKRRQCAVDSRDKPASQIE